MEEWAALGMPPQQAPQPGQQASQETKPPQQVQQVQQARQAQQAQQAQQPQRKTPDETDAPAPAPAPPPPVIPAPAPKAVPTEKVSRSHKSCSLVPSHENIYLYLRTIYFFVHVHIRFFFHPSTNDLHCISVECFHFFSCAWIWHL